jgi:phytoene dehydrogenase-like protein
MTDDATGRAVVVGAGLSGLVAARRLAAAGVAVDLFERRAEAGGRVRSRERDGFTLDRGFQVLFTAYPAVREELDLDALDLRTFRPGAVIARRGERSTLSDPLRDPRALVASAFNREVTTSDKLRTLALRQDLTKRDYDDLLSGPDTDIRSYLREWGFSERYIENFVAPFYGAITLDRSLSTSKRVFEYTFKALSEGRTAVPAEGMGAIPAQLLARAEDAGVDVHLDECVERIDDEGSETAVVTADRTVAADAVVVAADPRRARELTGVPSIPRAAKSSVTQHYALPGHVSLDSGRRIVLHADGDEPTTVAPMSAVASEYAPEDRTLLAATFLGREALDRPVETMATATRETLSSWYPERSFESLETLATDRIEFAQFAQPPGVHDDLPGPRTPDGDVYLAGDYTRWSSIQGALRSGADAAAAVLADRS